MNGSLMVIAKDKNRMRYSNAEPKFCFVFMIHCWCNPKKQERSKNLLLWGTV